MSDPIADYISDLMTQCRAGGYVHHLPVAPAPVIIAAEVRIMAAVPYHITPAEFFRTASDEDVLTVFQNALSQTPFKNENRDD